MKIIKIELNSLPLKIKPTVACIGYFDGIHKGHQKLINTALKVAKKEDLPTSLITFDPDPWVVLKNLKSVSHLTTLKQRINILNSMGIDYLYLVKFDKELSKLTPDQFVRELLIPLQIKSLVCGFDYTYGHFGNGKASDLLKYPEFKTVVVKAVNYRKEKISSTRIEKEISNGNFTMVNKLLGYPYQTSGKVIKGHQVGRTINYRTANILLDEEYVLPLDGVYCGWIRYDQKFYQAMINLGHNSSFNYRQQHSLEVHILDFNHDIYAKKLTVIWLKKIRDEKEFSSPAELKKQLVKDEKVVRSYLNNRKAMLSYSQGA